MNQGQAKALLTVDMVDGHWKVVSIGAAGLADELLKVVRAWPDTSGCSLRLIRTYQAMSDFIVISKAGATIGIVPLVSARLALGFGGNIWNRIYESV